MQNKPSRFDYVRYDEKSAELQAEFKALASNLESNIERTLKAGRERSLAITALEEVYMWIGKAIRNDQQSLRGDFTLQENRTNS